MKQRIAIQGYQGSFHHKAAVAIYGIEIEPVACDTFYDVIKAASDSNRADAAVMAIENSLVGSILSNYFLLQNNPDICIQGEIYLRINQHLLVNQEVKLEDIHEVHSHYMAVQQCLEYIRLFPTWRIVESIDTALSAQLIAEKKQMHVAAIGSDLAAKIFNLKIIVPNIHSKKDNYTRFLILQKRNQYYIKDANKASIYFHTDHSHGSLYKVLQIIAEQGINLSKLQSLPIPGTQFQYAFHADMEFEHVDLFFKTIDLLHSKTKNIQIFGIYKKGNWIL